MLHVDYIDNFETKALDTIRDLADEADRINIAVAFLSYRGWLELRPSLTALVARGGKLRLIVRRDRQQTSPEAVEEAFRLGNTQVAFGLTDTTFHPKDYLFINNNTLTVLTSSANATYPGLTHNEEGGAVIQHSDINSDEAAQKAIAIFERRWANATPLTEALIEDYKSEAQISAFEEGTFVRSISRIYEELGIGRIQKVRGLQAKVEFNPSVFMHPPYCSENKILPLSDLERIEQPLERASMGQWESPWRFELKMVAARFLTGNKGGQLSNARTEILPHQIFAAYRVVSSPRRRFLLADEVGLGKTIEAGMIWQALMQRGQANRTLIITPAGLTTQWQEEMQDKFGQLFEVFRRDFWAINPRIWDLKACAIASIDTLKRSEHKNVLLENRKWDLIIFDEAHKLSAMDYDSGKTDKTQNYRLAEELRNYCDALLFLTATPHQGEENNSRFKNLLLLLNDEIDFSGLEDYGLFAPRGVPYTELILRTPKIDVTDSNGRKVFKGRQTHRLPFKMYPAEARFYEEVENYIRTGYRALETITDEYRRRAAGFLLTTFQKLNASSTAAMKASLLVRSERLQKELADISSDDEEEIYDERYLGEYEENQILKDDREIMEDELDTLKALASMKVERDKKMDELLRLIDHISSESPRGNEEKVLIFTEYRKTQEYLVRELESKYGKGSAVIINGGMKLERREEPHRGIELIWAPFAREGALVAPTTKRTSQRLFRDHLRVRFLVSTEAGGEGINLQFCHIVVNYDLPWNPMRVEQRVGRIYRFGQDKVVQTYNFYNKGTIAEKVQSYFEDRLDRAAHALAQVTGEDPEDIKGTLNGQLESEIDPARVYKRTLVEGNLNPQTRKEIAEAVERAKIAYDIAANSLFRDVSSYSFDNYRRELASDLTLTELQKFTRTFLSRHRRQIQRKDQFFEFLTPDVLRTFGLQERYSNVTFDREIAIKRSDAEFMALGHHFVDAMLKYVGSYDFGGLTASRSIESESLQGVRGVQFNFVLRERITQEYVEEWLFSFHPVFVTETGEIKQEAAKAAVEAAGESFNASFIDQGKLVRLYQKAKEHLEDSLNLWDWDEEVELLNLSAVEFQG